MRLLATIALLGTSLSIATVRAEKLPASVATAAAARERTGPVPAVKVPPPPVIPATPSAPPVSGAPPLEFPVKETTAEELATIRIGASERDVLVALGMPGSRIVIPDDDGHLRKSYQYWGKGAPVGTIRLDNGYVVKVEIGR